MHFSFDRNEDTVNFDKHGLSLVDAPLVFNAPDKLSLESPRGTEARFMDVALVQVEVAGVVLV